jgi:hypothetical protein
MLFSFAYEAAGAADAPGIPCALCFWANGIDQLGRKARREKAQVCQIGVIPGCA